MKILTRNRNHPNQIVGILSLASAVFACTPPTPSVGSVTTNTSTPSAETIPGTQWQLPSSTNADQAAGTTDPIMVKGAARVGPMNSNRALSLSAGFYIVAEYCNQSLGTVTQSQADGDPVTIKLISLGSGGNPCGVDAGAAVIDVEWATFANLASGACEVLALDVNNAPALASTSHIKVNNQAEAITVAPGNYGIALINKTSASGDSDCSGTSVVLAN